jgi:hypothetical protein
MGLCFHLSSYNISYGRKKGRNSKCQFDSQPLKVKNLDDLRAFRGVPHIIGNEGYNFI